jgi:uncharacterized membrane-anchored protein YhcB (DUF1043 family)
MELWMWIVIAVVVVVIIALVILLLSRRKSSRLKKQFGPEYDRTVERLDSKDAAHEELQRRAERHDSYQLRSLDDPERAVYVQRWRQLQRMFVKEPANGLLEADKLLTGLLRDVGYPTENFDQQAADLSVEHADVTSDYRNGRAVVRDVQYGRAGTEEIRQALLHYRKVFERVAGTDVTAASDEAVT